MGSKRRHRQRRPARTRPSKNPKRRLLVACEGDVTEPSYIKGCEGKFQEALVWILPEHGDPRKLVELAKSERDRARAQAKRERDEFAAYDEVRCAFDRDQHERFEDACQMARDNQLELAVSNPCFELWLLLHFRESPGAQHRRHLQRKLKKFLPGYDKHFDFELVADRVDQAVKRAGRLDQQARRMGEPFLNPTTGVYRLIESIARVDTPAPSTESALRLPRSGQRDPARGGQE